MNKNASKQKAIGKQPLGTYNFVPEEVVRNAWEARFILVIYMCEETEEKTCPSWMLAVHGSQNTIY